MHAPGETFWLDELFEGGVVLPDTDEGNRRSGDNGVVGTPWDWQDNLGDGALLPLR